MRNVAIIGAGIGEHHADGYAALPDQFNVHTICDLDADRARPLVDKHNTDYSADLDSVLGNADVDIIDICLPPHLHFDIAMKALDAGKHVVCEKPLVSSLKEADALIAKAAETGKHVFPIFQYRYGIGTAQLHALIEAGLAGKCFAGTLETHWNRDADYYAVDWRGTWAGEQGGAILGHAIHIHDLLPSLIGPIRRVYAQTATRVNDIEVEDCAAITMTMQDGAVITSSVTLGAADNTSRLRLMFEGFTVESGLNPYAPATEPWTFTARAPCRQEQIDAVLLDLAECPSWFHGQFQATADALDGNPGREVSLADGRRSLEFVTAVYASGRNGNAVELPLQTDHPLYDGWLPN